VADRRPVRRSRPTPSLRPSGAALGGIACWAQHFGLPILFEVRSRERWTESRIRAGLELYLRRKRRFPTQEEFVADGLSGLHNAVRQTGGLRRWSAEFPLPTRPGQRRPVRARHGAVE